MERKISIADLQKAVDEAYEKFKDCNDGSVDPRSGSVNTSDFGISVMLADGTQISRGNTDVSSPMGSLGKASLAVLLMTQNTPDQIREKFSCSKDKGCGCKSQKPHIPVSAKGVRMISAVEPQGDPDGKWDLVIGNIINMMGSAPVLDDTLYRNLLAACSNADAENVIAQSGWYLYDDAATAIDQYAKLTSLKVTATQMANMMATIAVDGVNPSDKSIAFDGAISQRVAALMAVKGPHKMARPWLMCTGLPAMSSFGGLIAGTLPGVFGIAAYSPLVNDTHVSVRASKAIAYIMNKLQLSALSSARVSFVS